jgi:hypothetical protein
MYCRPAPSQDSVTRRCAGRRSARSSAELGDAERVSCDWARSASMAVCTFSLLPHADISYPISSPSGARCPDLSLLRLRCRHGSSPRLASARTPCARTLVPLGASRPYCCSTMWNAQSTKRRASCCLCSSTAGSPRTTCSVTKGWCH